MPKNAAVGGANSAIGTMAMDESSVHANPEKTMQQKTYKPPKHYGKVDIADLDLGNYRGLGEK